jgi:hypothetical protein
MRKISRQSLRPCCHGSIAAAVPRAGSCIWYRDDPDNLDFTFAAGITDALADHIIVGEELSSEGLIDDADLGRTMVILCREAAPTQQWYLHRRKIILAHCLKIGDVLPRSSRFCLAGQQDIIEPIVIREESDFRERRRSHARQVIQPLK